METTGQKQKKLLELDFTPLTQPVTKADITAFKLAHEPQTAWVMKMMRFTGYSLIALMVLGLVGTGFALLSHNSSLFSFAPVVMWLLFLGGIIYAVQLAIDSRYRLLVRLERFAIKNGLEFKYNASIATHYLGMIFDEGHSRQVDEVLVFPAIGEIGNYKYVTGSGKNRAVHYWGYIKTKLPRKLPHMVLDAKKNNMFGKISNLTDTFDRSQTLALEGDFNEYFTLYAPKQYERDAFYVFTPDVMAKLIDNGAQFDMEVIDDELYIYKSGRMNLTDEAQLRSMLSIFDTIGAELKDQTDYYADERVGDRAQNIVAMPGARLKHGVNWIVVTIVVVMVLLYTSDIWGYWLFHR